MGHHKKPKKTRLRISIIDFYFVTVFYYKDDICMKKSSTSHLIITAYIFNNKTYVKSN